MVGITLELALGFLAVALVVSFVRLMKGPSSVDRLLAVETASLIIMAIMAIMAMRSSMEFLVVVLIIAVLSIVSSVAVAKYLVKGRIF